MENASETPITRTDPTKEKSDGAKGFIDVFPTTVAFFGNQADFYPQKQRRFFRFSRRLPNLTPYRDILNSEKRPDPALNQKIRSELVVLAARFPYSADLQALKAIQSYQDAQQSGLSDQKFTAVEAIAQNLGRAINTQAYSLNNLAWFLRVFIHYLELLKKRLLTGYQVRDLKYSQAKRQLAVLHQQAIISQKEFEALYVKYEKTSFYSETIEQAEVLAAFEALRRGREKAPVGRFERPARVVQLIHLRLNLILARFPIFSPIIQQNIEATEGIVFRDRYLMNGMVTLSQMLNEYYLVLAKGDDEQQKTMLAEITQRCRENMAYLQENQSLNRDYEYDPLLKFALIAQENLKYPFHPQYKTNFLSQARLGLFKIINRSQDPSAVRLANRFISEIEAIGNAKEP
jgi:hypothetical protein